MSDDDLRDKEQRLIANNRAQLLMLAELKLELPDAVFATIVEDMVAFIKAMRPSALVEGN